MPVSRALRTDNVLMNFRSPEQRWIAEKTREIFVERSIPIPQAALIAIAEWEAMQKKPKANVIAIGQGRLFRQETET